MAVQLTLYVPSHCRCTLRADHRHGGHSGEQSMCSNLAELLLWGGEADVSQITPLVSMELKRDQEQHGKKQTVE